MTTKNIYVKKYNLIVKIKHPIYKLGFCDVRARTDDIFFTNRSSAEFNHEFSCGE